MVKVDISPSPLSQYKFVAIFSKDGKKIKTTHFGLKGATDYTMMPNTKESELKRHSYQTRHRHDLKTQNPMRAGYLSLFVLWGDSHSMQTNIQAYKKKFGFE
jgi:hypothetical protein